MEEDIVKYKGGLVECELHIEGQTSSSHLDRLTGLTYSYQSTDHYEKRFALEIVMKGHAWLIDSGIMQTLHVLQ